ncbi:hypothetical protein [Desulfonatronovibrio magnus]|uniref:hypothetical protein n=1 Tax=Desulfonatronovibrio magnus TaxID=698827 RepID=UPI0005EB9197|nr:hypothetical protein [Desulfonatronovibrio magnus]
MKKLFLTTFLALGLLFMATPNLHAATGTYIDCIYGCPNLIDCSGVIASESSSAAILVASEAKQSRAKAITSFLCSSSHFLKKRLKPQEQNVPRLEPGNEGCKLLAGSVPGRPGEKLKNGLIVVEHLISALVLIRPILAYLFIIPIFL